MRVQGLPGSFISPDLSVLVPSLILGPDKSLITITMRRVRIRIIGIGFWRVY